MGSSARAAHEVTRDDDALDLARALADRAQLRVAPHALDRILAAVPVAAVDLDRVVGDAHRDLGGMELRHRGRGAERLARILQACGVVDEVARRLDLHRHVGELEGDRLVLVELLAEGLAIAGVAARAIEGALSDAEAERADRDPPALER